VVVGGTVGVIYNWLVPPQGTWAAGCPVKTVRWIILDGGLAVKRFAVTLVAALVALAPAPVAAERPAREGLPAAPFTLDASICGFAVDLAFPTNREFITTFSNGKQIITGSLFVTLTNEQNHKSLTINISGPGSIVTDANGNTTLTLSGRSLIFFFPGQLGPGSPGLLILTSGPVTIVSDPTGNIVSFDRTSASVQDMCSALADP